MASSLVLAAMRLSAVGGASVRTATAALAPTLVGRRMMSDFPADRKYKSSHEWLKIEGDVGTIGITTHAADELGDIVFVDLPEVGKDVDKDGTVAAIESVKAVSDIYSPVAGVVVEINEQLSDEPSTINSDAHEAGWIAKVKMNAPAEADELMDATAYSAKIDAGE